DGGFGHAMEPDAFDPWSSVLDTTVALRLADLAGVPAEHPLRTAAIGYLAGACDRRISAWWIRPRLPAADRSAPWWQAASLRELQVRFAGGHINPAAEVAAHLLAHAAHRPQDLPAGCAGEAAARATAAIETRRDEMEMHEMLCAARLLQAVTAHPGGDGAEESLRLRLAGRLNHLLPRTIEPDPAKWSGYGLRPLDVLTTSDHPLAGAVPADLIARNLDHLLAEQDPAGLWRPRWSWAEVNADLWAMAHTAWSGLLTVEAVATLLAWRESQSL
ncbi:MAG: hypothetical protein RIC83_00020, partial [Alphaproteobacteria bacterium]